MDIESRRALGRVLPGQGRDVRNTPTLKQSPWYVVDADNKRRARLNCIAHLLRQIPYKALLPEALELPPRQQDTGYKRPAKDSQRWVPKLY